MKTVYTTSGFDGDRASLWRGVIRDVYAHLEIDVAPGPEFSGQIVRSQLGAIEITDVRTDTRSHGGPVSISRAVQPTPTSISWSRAGYCM